MSWCCTVCCVLVEERHFGSTYLFRVSAVWRSVQQWVQFNKHLVRPPMCWHGVRKGSWVFQKMTGGLSNRMQRSQSL